jgi:hypothetical protein
MNNENLKEKIRLLEEELKKIKTHRRVRRFYRYSPLEEELKKIRTEVEANSKKNWFLTTLQKFNKIHIKKSLHRH